MLKDYRFSYPIRVRYSEIDGQKIVFNAHYATYIDVANTEYYRNLFKKGWIEVEQEYDFDLVVRKITIDYLLPARFDDLLDVYCRVKKIGTTSIISEFLITRQQEVLVEAEVIQVSFDKQTSTSKPIPSSIKETIAAFEEIEM